METYLTGSPLRVPQRSQKYGGEDPGAFLIWQTPRQEWSEGTGVENTGPIGQAQGLWRDTMPGVMPHGQRRKLGKWGPERMRIWN